MLICCWRLRVHRHERDPETGCSQQEKFQCNHHLPPPFLVPSAFLLPTFPYTINTGKSVNFKVFFTYLCVYMYMRVGFFLSPKSLCLLSSRHLEATRTCISLIIALEGYVQQRVKEFDLLSESGSHYLRWVDLGETLSVWHMSEIIL